ncbi:MAG: ion transporter [Planctomycetes bacterium]|nr:ion transporter [Planctomycetota bacterium]
MKPSESPNLAPLRALLHDATTPPATIMAALAAERARLAGSGPLAHELLELELRWLGAQPEVRDPATAAALEAARREALRLRVRGLAATAGDEPAALFDLAEAQAAAQALGEHELARDCEVAIARGVPLSTAGEALDQEAAERFAVLSTAIDEISVAHQVRLLQCSGRVARQLALHTGSKACAGFGRRLLRAADDRELARRLEAIVGARGITAIETTNFVLLLVVLLILLVEATVDLSPLQSNVLQWIDAAACSFFVLDFAFELALHPRRLSWFLRNAVTDLLPAVPSVLWLLPGVSVPGVAENAVVLRALRLLRVTWAARYVQALRPLLRSARLLLFLVRGLDGLAARFGQILNREFVFVPAAADVKRPVLEEDLRDLSFAALRREHELTALLPAAARGDAVLARLRALGATVRTMGPCDGPMRSAVAQQRDVPIDHAIEFLWSLRPQDIGRWLRPTDMASLDRMLRVLSAVPVRWLPIVRRFAVHPLPATAEDRIVQFARRAAEWLESWHGRMLFFADLHGIVTGPQILDRVATAMVKASQRPAVRLLLFGGLFLFFDLLIGSESCSRVLSKIVAMPLIVLGSLCLVFLTVGHWLKRLAGQASETYRLTSEAHFISQLERVKPRYERQDLAFLARRVFGEQQAATAEAALRTQVGSARTGVPVDDEQLPPSIRLAANRVVLLYLHFLDGAPLHISDVKTTEQLLANHSLENLRVSFLGSDARDRRRLRKLRLDDGSLLSGPYLWFRFITESVAVESAKRIAGYNQFCIPLLALAHATPAEREAMQDWLRRRRDPRGGRTLGQRGKAKAPVGFPTTEFTALDFASADGQRDRHIAELFGEQVLEVLQFDRRTMVREIFGTRPVHNLPQHERSFNPLRFYRRRLSHGRVLLAPLLLLWRFVRSIGWLVARLRQIVREVVDPELAMQRREVGAAPFAVALRKIHRMKAPGLLEAIRMRLQLDPVYAGAPPGWSKAEPFAAEPEVERDIGFLHLREQEAAELRDAAADVRRWTGELHAALAWLPKLGAAADDDTRDAGELAVTAAWIADKDSARTLLAAERWRSEVLPALLEQARGAWSQDLLAWLRGLFVRHPVDRWLERHGRDLPAQVRRPLRRAYARDLQGVRRLLDAWAVLPAGASPAEAAIDCLRAAYRQGPAVQRDLLALRAVQSLAVLDVRNYRDLVFQLGDYAAEGEDPHLGAALP